MWVMGLFGESILGRLGFEWVRVWGGSYRGVGVFGQRGQCEVRLGCSQKVEKILDQVQGFAGRDEEFGFDLSVVRVFE